MKQDTSSEDCCLVSTSLTVTTYLIIGNDNFFKDFRCHFLFGNHQSRALAQILLEQDAFLNLPVKLCGINQWIFQPLLQLVKSQSISTTFLPGQQGHGSGN
jgi:hypothetical protein